MLPPQKLMRTKARTFADVVSNPANKAGGKTFDFQPVWKLRDVDWEGNVLDFDTLASELAEEILKRS